MSHRIYFEIDNPDVLLDWLRSRPSGAWHILIGSDGDADVTERLLALVAGEGRDLAAWLVGRLGSGAFQVRTSARIAGMPQGVALKT